MSNLDFYKEVLRALNRFEIKYLIAGGYAVNLYGYFRSTGDMDIWIDNRDENLRKLTKVLVSLNYSTDDINKGISDLKQNKNISLIHNNFFKVEFIPLLSTYLSFDTAFGRKSIKKLLGINVNVVDFDDLCTLKIKSGRKKDFEDVYHLKNLREKKNPDL